MFSQRSVCERCDETHRNGNATVVKGKLPVKLECQNRPNCDCWSVVSTLVIIRAPKKLINRIWKRSRLGVKERGLT